MYKEKIFIQHAGNAREYQIGPYKVDGIINFSDSFMLCIERIYFSIINAHHDNY